MTKVFAIASQKGGVAKTTTCLSLGAALAELDKSVLMIDLDPQANLTLSLGFRPGGLRRTVGDAIFGNTSLVGVSLEGPVFNLDLVPANQGLAVVDKVLYERKNYEHYLERRLQELNSNLYDVVMIDCPPAFGTLTLNALTAADTLIVPVQCEYYAAWSLLNILELVKLIRRRTNPGLNYRMLITMFDRRNRISHIVYDQIQRTFGKALFKTMVEVDTKLRESPTVGKPITAYAPRTRATRQYRKLAEEILRYEQ